MARLAKRVRLARAALGLPRRVLSERSGVSPRYLAQLEAGEGNISVLLLNRVAAALDLPIEDLVRADAPMDADVARVVRLYQSAPQEVQGRVRALLAPEGRAAPRAQRIALLGLRGAGKSTLGALAADKLNIPFVELTAQIEATTGLPAGEIIARDGMDGFRTLEARALDAVVESHSRGIIAVSGGIVASPETYSGLLERFHTVWVRTSPAEHLARVRAQGDARSMAGNAEVLEQLRIMLCARTSDYERAVAQVDTTSRPVQSSVNDLLAAIAKHQMLGDLEPV